MSSHRKSSTLSLSASRNKPLPPILLDNSESSSNSIHSPIDTFVPKILHSPMGDNTHFSLPQKLSTQSLPELQSSNTHNENTIKGYSETSIFQPKTLKRRNLKKLTLENKSDGSVSALASPLNLSGSRSAIPTPKSAASSKNDDLELQENFEALTLSINNQFHLRQQDLLTLKSLGEGQSGTVTKVLHVPSNKLMAKKQIMFEKNFKVQNQILRELKILNEVHHSSIIEFYGAVFIDSAGISDDTETNGSSNNDTTEKESRIPNDAVSHSSSSDDKKIPSNNTNYSSENSGVNSNGVLICMEYMDCGSLDHILKKLGFLKEVYLSKITINVLQGLNYLYSNHKILHRDIKPSNVLLNSRGEIKLADFGVSRELNNNSIADTFVGTSTYMSPERIQGDVYSIKGDVWSVGLMLIELSTGEFPFGKKDTPNGILDLLQRIVNEDPPSLPRTKFSNELCDFVDLCLKRQNERPTPLELLDLPRSFLTKYQNEESGPLLRHLSRKLKKLKK
ncbi:hypothetical protein WICMUC_004411 [Wickerhamomyces mucosus]|uniref:mitogen-activated protein kinase kinase n=1 Tax=Wickerhamomyces mucosus TaxID=1378264 RepID=A0A9P8PHI3_9ASCO|nr:hypothetical protein WICMUC_004411 [Wickerhamomyces mucosus]